ncbi:uncharacterized protein A4U43_C05F29570 [Asparagus officinalis]|uniref:Uncharacterized protein n=1 Tax=Asparagus officinalis TaxID=4686 RepID=A0A5P1EW18_ASPOF|nr:uncharacterized protein A4U43_C05F29570 [Asparagus officinalis]
MRPLPTLGLDRATVSTVGRLTMRSATIVGARPWRLWLTVRAPRPLRTVPDGAAVGLYREAPCRSATVRARTVLVPCGSTNIDRCLTGATVGLTVANRAGSTAADHGGSTVADPWRIDHATRADRRVDHPDRADGADHELDRVGSTMYRCRLYWTVTARRGRPWGLDHVRPVLTVRRLDHAHRAARCRPCGLDSCPRCRPWASTMRASPIAGLYACRPCLGVDHTTVRSVGLTMPTVGLEAIADRADALPTWGRSC